MTAVISPPAVDGDVLMGFVFRAIDEVGASLNSALVVMGDRLGYYRALAEQGPLTPNSLAHLTNTAEPYAREWLAAQAAGGYLGYDPETRTFSISPEVAMAMTDETSPAYLPGFFQIAYGTIRDANRIFEAAATGDGLGWHDHNTDVHVGCERFFRPGYLANLTASWLPALDGVVAKLEYGAKVADMGCGHGSSSVLMAQAYPASRIHGSDYHGASIDVARDAGPGGRRGRARPSSRSPPPTASPGPGSTSSRRSTPCTTWATRSAPPGTSTTLSPTTAPGWSSSRRPATTSRTTSPGRSGLLRVLDAALHPRVAVPGGRSRARHAGRPGQDPRRRDGRRVHPVPDRRADPAQHHLRDPQVATRHGRGD